MELTPSVDDKVFEDASRIAHIRGKSMDQLVSDLLMEFSALEDEKHKELARELANISKLSTGDSNGWKFNRDEIYDERLGLL